MMSFEAELLAAKRASMAQVLFRCARLLNERALATLPASGAARPRPSHMALFPHIDLQHGTRVTELAQRLGISKQAVTQLVDDLEAMDLVARIADPDDGRAKRVIFTAAGRSGLLEGLAHLQRLEKGLARAIGKQTMQTLHEALLVLHDHLDPPHTEPSTPEL